MPAQIEGYDCKVQGALQIGRQVAPIGAAAAKIVQKENDGSVPSGCAGVPGGMEFDAVLGGDDMFFGGGRFFFFARRLLCGGSAQKLAAQDGQANAQTGAKRHTSDVGVPHTKNLRVALGAGDGP
jgi:hypothetical protein